MKNTTNYNLKLPEGPDKYNISDFNENTEKIDGELKKHADYIADRYNKTEIDNKFSMHEMNVDWKESVDTFDDIVVAYPAPESGWTVNVKDTNYTYRYDGTDWIAISSNAIPKATQAVDGLMSKEQAAVLNKLDQAVGSLQNLTTSEKQSLVGAVNEVKSEVIQLNEDLNSALYPVGIVVAFVNGFNPNESLQGEWERIAKGRTLVGVNEADPDFNTAEQSGGLKDVTLSINQIPAHSHQESDLSYVYTDEHPANNSIVTTNQNGRQNINMNINSKTYTKNAGEGGAHSNL